MKYDEYILGVNYWPINNAMNFWKLFDKSLVEDDFSRIKEINIRLVRIFLLWEDFQPLPRKVSIKMIDHLITLMEIANDKGLKVLPTFFTGHMSGVNYLPPWMLDFGDGNIRFPLVSEGRRRKNNIKNFYNDKEILEAQKFLIREISNALKGHPSLWGWDLGNEPSNLVQPSNKNEGLTWLEEMVSELKKIDESIPITLGLHQEDLIEDRNMGPEEVSKFCDFLSIHTYSIYAKWASHRLDEEVVPFLAIITYWLGSKEVLIEEVGIPSSNSFEDNMIVSEEEAYQYYERLLKKLKKYSFLGTIFWCYGDYERSLWKEPPFDENHHERFFGLFREDKSPKPFVNLIKTFEKNIERETLTYEWIDIEPKDYYKDPLENLKHLYQRFKDFQG